MGAKKDFFQSLFFGLVVKTMEQKEPVSPGRQAMLLRALKAWMNVPD